MITDKLEQLNSINKLTKENIERLFFPYQKEVNRYPLTNIGTIESEDGPIILIEIACAGFKKEDIVIESKDNIIYVKGSRDLTSHDKVTYHQKHISGSDFERVLHLHDSFIDGNIEAKMDDGLISIRVKQNKKSSKKINLL